MCVMISEYLYQCGAIGVDRPASIPPAQATTDDDVEPLAIDLESFSAPPEVLQL